MTRTTDEQVDQWRDWIYTHHFADGNGNEPNGTGALRLLDMVVAERARGDWWRERAMVQLERALCAEGNAGHETAMLQATRIRRLVRAVRKLLVSRQMWQDRAIAAEDARKRLSAQVRFWESHMKIDR